MIAQHVHQALRQVQELKLRVLASERFAGYSGRCRAAGGAVALLAAPVLGASWFPRTAVPHLVGWGAVLTVALLANYSAVLYWFLFHPDVKRDIRRLMPTVDAIPSLIVGAILTLFLISRGDYDALFGTWMCLYGLVNLSSRSVMPKTMWPLGSFYVASGALCLFLPGVSFCNPWPMALTFGLGELAGGLVFHYHQRRAHAEES